MNPIRRFLDWRQDVLTPDHVEKASRRERWKRTAWEVISTLLSFGTIAGALGVITSTNPGFPPTSIAGGFVAVLAVLAALGLDILVVFPWGLERWDIVPPWQFRDADAEEREG